MIKVKNTNKYIVLIVVVFFFGCKENNKLISNGYKKEAIQLNNLAVNLVAERGINDSCEYNDILKLLDKSIEIDSLYYWGYINKAIVLVYAKKESEAIKVMTEVINKNIKNNKKAKNYTLRGLIYKIDGRDSLAKSDLLFARDIYIKESLNNKNQDNERISMEIIFLTIYIDGKGRALAKANELFNESPNKYGLLELFNGFTENASDVAFFMHKTEE